MKILGAVALVLSLAGCADEPAPVEPEVAHCATVAGRATQVYGEITIVRVHHWALNEERSVQLRFAYPPDYEDFQFGNITCVYPFTLDLQANPKRIVKAKAVYFKGRYLSENELDFVNSSLFRPKPEFKTNP